MTMAVITAVIPLYNKERQIERAIRSVLQQTFQDWHLIVVDDGSTDGSARIAGNIKDPRIELVRQDNAGPAAARNVGIAKAQTEFVAFLDADDEWHPDFLDVTLNAMRHNDVSMVSTTTLCLPKGYDTAEILQKSHIVPGVFSFSGHEDPKKVKDILSIIIAINNLVRTDIVRKHGSFYDKRGCLFGEDRALLWRIAFNEPFMIIGQPLTYYHVEDSTLGQHTAQRPVPPYLQDPSILLDYCPQSVHSLINKVLDLLVLQYVSNQLPHSSRFKLLYLLLKYPGTRCYSDMNCECLKRLTPGFTMWQNIKKYFRERQ